LQVPTLSEVLPKHSTKPSAVHGRTDPKSSQQTAHRSRPNTRPHKLGDESINARFSSQELKTPSAFINLESLPKLNQGDVYILDLRDTSFMSNRFR